MSSEQPERKSREAKERDMLTRVTAAVLALLSFFAVCFAGLWQGHSFHSVMRGALVALIVGGVAGAILSMIIRVVVTESFNRQHPREGLSPAAPGAETESADGAAQQQAEPPAQGIAGAAAETAGRTRN